MYKLYYRTDENDEKLLYSPYTNNSDEYALSECTLDLEKNASGSLTFTMPSTHLLYSKMSPLKDVGDTRRCAHIVVYKKGKVGTYALTDDSNNNVLDSYGNPINGLLDGSFEWYWEGRILDVEIDDFSMSKKVTCEGVLGYLNDTVQALISATRTGNTAVADLLELWISHHNFQMIHNFLKFNFSRSHCNVEPTTKNSSGTKYITRVTNFESTFDSIGDRLVSYLGGYLYVERSSTSGFDLYYKADKKYYSSSDATPGKTVKFGQNLLNYSSKIDQSEIFTVAIPVGPEMDIESVLGFYESTNKTVRRDWWRYNWKLSTDIPQKSTMRIRYPEVDDALDAEQRQARERWLTARAGYIQEIEGMINKANASDPDGYNDVLRSEWNSGSHHVQATSHDKLVELVPASGFYNYQSSSVDTRQNDYIGIKNKYLCDKYGYIAKVIDVSENFPDQSEMVTPSGTSDANNVVTPNPKSILNALLNIVKENGWVFDEEYDARRSEWNITSYMPYNWEFDLTGYDLSVVDNTLDSTDIMDIIECSVSYKNADSKLYLPVTQLSINLLDASNNSIKLGDAHRYELTTEIISKENFM